MSQAEKKKKYIYIYRTLRASLHLHLTQTPYLKKVRLIKDRQKTRKKTYDSFNNRDNHLPKP